MARSNYIRIPQWTPLRGVRPIQPGQEGFFPEKEVAQAWQSLDNDPQFVTDISAWRSGWYLLELGIEHDQPGGMAALYLDTGQGFNEKQCIGLPLHRNGSSESLLCLPAKAKALRLDPLASEGCFAIHTCRFSRLSATFPTEYIADQLSYAHAAYQDQPRAEVIARLKERARGAGRSLDEEALFAYQESLQQFKRKSSYFLWLQQRGWDKQLDEDHVKEQLAAFERKPLISIVMPAYNTNVQHLQECVESVKAQSYPHWQLCIADDKSSSEDTREALRDMEESDQRIQVVWRETNGHISAASNSALEIAKGEFTALLDHDDLLIPDALFHVVEALNHNPEALLIYSDEDKVDATGLRFDPHFKPDWNPDLLLSQNYISHLGVYKTERLRQIGGFREGFEGSQDHDLVLRFTTGLSDTQIVHIHRVLYHWRVTQGSTALAGAEKDYAEIAGMKAVEDYLCKRGREAEVVSGKAPNSYRVCWSLPDPAPLVSLLVPTRDGVHILKPCIDALLERTEYTNFELLILDNQSTCPDTLNYMEEVEDRDKRVRVLRWDHPFNFSAINNFGAREAKGSILGLINNDIEPINPDWLGEMVSQACRPEIGCVGAKLYYPDNTLQHAGVIVGLGGVAGHSHKYFPGDSAGYFFRLKLIQNLSAVTAACLLVRKSVFEEAGGLNEKDLKVAFNDIDFCLKVRQAGYRNLWTPYAELVHHESVSRGAEDNPEKVARFQSEIEYMKRVWGEELEYDPAYNVNLTKDYENFSLA